MGSQKSSESGQDGAKGTSTTLAYDQKGDNTATSTNTMKSTKTRDGDAITTSSSGSSDVEKGRQHDSRASIFLGKPMTIVHELVFFAVVSTANFTPRRLTLYSFGSPGSLIPYDPNPIA